MSKLFKSFFVAAVGCIAAHLPALAQAPATPAAPPADPFVRERNAKPATPPAAKPEPPPVNILTTIETWSLSQADFVELLDSPPHERAPYDRLEAMAKAGKAKLVGLIAVATKSGQRAVAEAIDEVRYPVEFDPAPRMGEIHYPTAWQTRNVGETLELEPTLGPDGKTIDVNLVPQTVRLQRFQDLQPEEGAAAVSQPQFDNERVTTSTTVQSGRPVLLGTATPARAEDGPAQVRIRMLTATAQPATPGIAATAGNLPNVVRVEALVYSLEREAARRILAESSDSRQSFDAVRALVASGAAQLETLSMFLTKPGQRGVNEETLGFTYPSGVSPPGYESHTATKETRHPASFTRFETRNVGVTFEIEPNLSPDGRYADINVIPQIVKHNGPLQADGAAAKYPPQPLFTTRKVTTSLTGGAGLPALVGTMSQPGSTGVNGRKDDGRTSLAYIRVTPVRP